MIVPTAAALVFAQYTMLPPTMMPPQRYDHPFKGKVIVEDLISCKGCSGFTVGPRNGVCRIFVLKNSSIRDIIIRHEIAHCNGWPANHPR